MELFLNAKLYDGAHPDHKLISIVNKAMSPCNVKWSAHVYKMVAHLVYFSAFCLINCLSSFQ